MHLATLALNQGGDKPGNQSLPRNFLCMILDFQKKCCVDLCFMWNIWTNYSLLIF